ncbi:Uncharacterized protein Fot_30860 [Forsythia ovata]|uniref:Uncharacterized protein n=1 Tax=Forsythia ovata TaxID=205694 RepID=A0ABD1T3U1_9LAMI
MAYMDLHTPRPSSIIESFDPSETFDFVEIPNSSTFYNHDIPKPLPLPTKVLPKMKNLKGLAVADSSCVTTIDFSLQTFRPGAIPCAINLHTVHWRFHPKLDFFRVLIDSNS